MKKSAILMNGVSLPHHVLDNGLTYAKSSGSPMKVVFIYENIDEEDYKLPEEAKITNADISESNAARNLEELVEHNSSYVDTFFENNNIAHETIVLKNPTIAEIATSLIDTEKIYVDLDTFKHPDEFAYVNFTLEELQEQISGRIVWCRRPE